jgi:hypothetical protein
MSAFAKIPLQALILLTGVLMFVFYLFNRGPMLFNDSAAAAVHASPRAAEYQALEQEYNTAFDERRDAAQVLGAASRAERPAAAATRRRRGFSARTPR